MVVEITGVITGEDSSPGACDATDFTIFNPRMPVDRLLNPEGSAPFSGASIGFANKSTNQDACQGAVIRLRYTASPD